jgi:hypothetical protein
VGQADHGALGTGLPTVGLGAVGVVAELQLGTPALHRVPNEQPGREAVRLQLGSRLADDVELGLARRGQFDHQPEL